MIIGGYQPCSLCDYPGLVAAVIFTQGCNFRCPFCHNGALLPSVVSAEHLLSVDDVLNRVKQRRGQLDAVVIGGGEPTLHTDLPAFIDDIRTWGLAIKLDTNGSKPAMLKELLHAKLVDYIAMDIKAPWEKYDTLTDVHSPIEAIKESMLLIAHSGLPHEFRTTMVPSLLTPDDIEAIRAQLPAGSPYRLQVFKAEHALDEKLRLLYI